MIISASKRCDIPAFYSDWFINRLKEGYAYVRNPVQTNIVYEVELTPETVDCIVFWTKNPKPMLDRLDELSGYPYYFQYTLNWYGKDMEPNVPDIKDRVETFIKLSEKIGRERVVWRYDPIVFTDVYTPDWHRKCFATLAEILHEHTEKAVISLVDLYPRNTNHLVNTGYVQINYDERIALLKDMAEIAHKYGLVIATCAENIPEAPKYGIFQNSCIDRELVERVIGTQIYAQKSNSRSACNCVENVDIGSYDACPHRCIYCYAKPKTDMTGIKYDPDAPMLKDKYDPENDVLKKRLMYSLKVSETPF